MGKTVHLENMGVNMSYRKRSKPNPSCDEGAGISWETNGGDEWKACISIGR